MTCEKKLSYLRHESTVFGSLGILGINTRISERAAGYVEELPQQVSSPRTHQCTGPARHIERPATPDQDQNDNH